MQSDYKFSEEKFDDGLISDMVPLLERHHLELSHYKDIPLNPDFESYKRIYDLKMMKVFTARVDNSLEMNGELVGYNIFIVSKSLHYSDYLCAVQDSIYIDKKRRGFGLSFIKWCDKKLQDVGIQVVYQHMKAQHSFGLMLERIGYELVDLIYAKRLGE